MNTTIDAPLAEEDKSAPDLSRDRKIREAELERNLNREDAYVFAAKRDHAVITATTLYMRLEIEGLTPSLVHDLDNETDVIQLPTHEIPRLRELQKKNPDRWGNCPVQGGPVPVTDDFWQGEGLKKLCGSAKFIEETSGLITAFCRESQVSPKEAKALVGQLMELSSQHCKLCLIDEDLTSRQEAARDVIEGKIIGLLRDVPGVSGATLAYNPQSSTMGVHFAVSDRIVNVPRDSERLAELESEPFWEEYAPADHAPEP